MSGGFSLIDFHKTEGVFNGVVHWWSLKTLWQKWLIFGIT